MGSDKVADGVDVVPSTTRENVRKLGLAVEERSAEDRYGVRTLYVQ